MDIVLDDAYLLMGTGTRDTILYVDPRAFYLRLEKYVLETFADKISAGNLILIAGGAEGFDEMFAAVGFRNNIPVMLYIPTRDYGDYYWRRNSKCDENRMREFEHMLSLAHSVHYMEDRYGSYRKTMQGPKYEVNGKLIHANFARNQAMVDDCHGCCAYDFPSRGAQDAIRRVREAGKELYVFDKIPPITRPV